MRDKLIPINIVTVIDDDATSLNIDFREIGYKSGNSEFQKNLELIWSTREAIKQVYDLGLQDRIGQPILQYYVEALRWMKGLSATSSWIAIQPLGSTGDTNTEMNQFYGSWVPNYLSTFYSSPLLTAFYAQTQKVRREIISKAALNEVDVIRQSAINSLQEEANKISNLIEEQVKNTISEMNSTKTGFLGEVEEKKNDVQKTIAFSKLTDWSKYYADRVNEYEIMINGRQKIKRKNKKDFFKLNTYQLFNWTQSLKGRRVLWFIMFSLFVSVFILIASGLLEINIPKELAEEINNPILFKISIAIPLLLIPSLGYAFSNKNYRIYSNLLEQYKHRQVVAQTLTGIIASLGNDPENEDVRKQLTEVGAKALFEHKNIGHLTKKESENSPVAEIFQTIRSN